MPRFWNIFGKKPDTENTSTKSNSGENDGDLGGMEHAQEEKSPRAKAFIEFMKKTQEQGTENPSKPTGGGDGGDLGDMELGFPEWTPKSTRLQQLLDAAREREASGDEFSPESRGSRAVDRILRSREQHVPNPHEEHERLWREQEEERERDRGFEPDL